MENSSNEMPPTSVEPPAEVVQLMAARDRGAGWFGTIALLGIVNSALALLKIPVQFIFGLGLPMLVAAVGTEMENVTIQFLSVVITVVAAGMAFGLGNYARKGYSWAFIVGIVLYGLDGLIMLWLAQMDSAAYIDVFCHAFALYCLCMGLKANWDLNRLTRE